MDWDCKKCKWNDHCYIDPSEWQFENQDEQNEFLADIESCYANTLGQIKQREYLGLEYVCLIDKCPNQRPGCTEVVFPKYRDEYYRQSEALATGTNYFPIRNCDGEILCRKYWDPVKRDIVFVPFHK